MTAPKSFSKESRAWLQRAMTAPSNGERLEYEALIFGLELQNRYLRDAIATGRLPDEWVLVPVKPTYEMVAACGDLPGSMQEMWERALKALGDARCAG